MKTLKTLFILNIIGHFFACQGCSNPGRDEFYLNEGGFDYKRVPLLKPYEAICLNRSEAWIMNLYNVSLNTSVPNIEKVNVYNGIILLQSGETSLNGDRFKAAWYIVIPSKHIELGFPRYNDYVKALSKYGVKSVPRLLDINRLRAYFIDHGSIDWTMIK